MYKQIDFRWEGKKLKQVKLVVLRFYFYFCISFFLLGSIIHSTLIFLSYISKITLFFVIILPSYIRDQIIIILLSPCNQGKLFIQSRGPIPHEDAIMNPLSRKQVEPTYKNLKAPMLMLAHAILTTGCYSLHMLNNFQELDVKVLDGILITSVNKKR